MSDFFWLNINGTIISDGYNHINAISANPSAFGLDDKLISTSYKRFKEKTGTEGKAREYLMKIAMKNGWIRIRNAGGMWVIESWLLDEQTKGAIFEFVLVGNRVKRYDSLIITQVSNDKIERYDDRLTFKKSFMNELW